MKVYLLLPFVLLAGLVIGGIGPRSELAGLRAELEQARKLAVDRGRGGVNVAGVGGLLGIERRSAEQQSGRAPVRQEAAPSGAEEGESGSAVGALDLADAPGEEAASAEAAARAWDLDHAIELWQTRVGIATSTFVTNARLNDAQALHFETALVAMNIRIGTTIDEFADSIRGAEAVQPEAGIRLVNAITDAMVTAYNEMDETLPQGWRRQAGQRFSLTDFIDPEVARPMVGLEERLQF